MRHDRWIKHENAVKTRSWWLLHSLQPFRGNSSYFQLDVFNTFVDRLFSEEIWVFFELFTGLSNDIVRIYSFWLAKNSVKPHTIFFVTYSITEMSIYIYFYNFYAFEPCLKFKANGCINFLITIDSQNTQELMNS